MPRHALIQVRKGDTASWAAVNPVLEVGEPGFDTQTLEMRIGDGAKTWSQLDPIRADATPGLLDPATIVAPVNIQPDPSGLPSTGASVLGMGTATDVKWISVPLDLEELTSVTLPDKSQLKNDEVLTWNGTAWVNKVAYRSKLTTEGDILVRGDTGDERMGIGAANYILRVKDPATGSPKELEWAKNDATSTIVSATGNLTSTNVQAALTELQDDIDLLQQGVRYLGVHDMTTALPTKHPLNQGPLQDGDFVIVDNAGTQDDGSGSNDITAKEGDNLYYLNGVWHLVRALPIFTLSAASDVDPNMASNEAEGDIIYHNGTNWTKLAKGTAEEVLMMNKAADAPVWSDVRLDMIEDPTKDTSIDANHQLDLKLSRVEIQQRANTNQNGLGVRESGGTNALWLWTEGTNAKIRSGSTAGNRLTLQPVNGATTAQRGTIVFHDQYVFPNTKPSGGKVLISSTTAPGNIGDPWEVEWGNVLLNQIGNPTASSTINLANNNLVINAGATAGVVLIDRAKTGAMSRSTLIASYSTHPERLVIGAEDLWLSAENLAIQDEAGTYAYTLPSTSPTANHQVIKGGVSPNRGTLTWGSVLLNEIGDMSANGTIDMGTHGLRLENGTLILDAKSDKQNLLSLKDPISNDGMNFRFWENQSNTGHYWFDFRSTGNKNVEGWRWQTTGDNTIMQLSNRGELTLNRAYTLPNTAPAAGQVLGAGPTGKLDELRWISISTSLSGLTDTNITSPASNSILTYSGGKWIDAARPAYMTRWPKWSEVTGKPSNLLTSSSNISWSKITGEPTYTKRWPKWNEITTASANVTIVNSGSRLATIYAKGTKAIASGKSLMEASYDGRIYLSVSSSITDPGVSIGPVRGTGSSTSNSTSGRYYLPPEIKSSTRGQYNGNMLAVSTGSKLNWTRYMNSFIVVPSGTTGQRGAQATAGAFRFNSSSKKFEGYNGTSWGDISGGGGGSVKITDIADDTSAAAEIISKQFKLKVPTQGNNRDGYILMQGDGVFVVGSDNTKAGLRIAEGTGSAWGAGYNLAAAKNYPRNYQGQVMIWDGGGVARFSTNYDEGLLLPSGGNSSRGNVQGLIRYNTSSDEFEGCYPGGNWKNLGGGGSGGSSTAPTTPPTAPGGGMAMPGVSFYLGTFRYNPHTPGFGEYNPGNNANSEQVTRFLLGRKDKTGADWATPYADSIKPGSLMYVSYKGQWGVYWMIYLVQSFGKHMSSSDRYAIGCEPFMWSGGNWDYGGGREMMIFMASAETAKTRFP